MPNKKSHTSKLERKNVHTNQMQAIHLRTDSMDMEQTKGVTSNLNGKRDFNVKFFLIYFG